VKLTQALYTTKTSCAIIYIKTSQDIRWIPTSYHNNKNNPKKEDGLCMNMEPEFGALSLELKV
jgi:hypothetical protein